MPVHRIFLYMGKPIEVKGSDRFRSSVQGNVGHRVHARGNKMYRRIAWFVLLLTALAHGRAHAHELGQSYIFLSIYHQSLQGRFEVTVGDLNQALGLDFRTDGTVTSTKAMRRPCAPTRGFSSTSR